MSTEMQEAGTALREGYTGPLPKVVITGILYDDNDEPGDIVVFETEEDGAAFAAWAHGRDRHEHSNTKQLWLLPERTFDTEVPSTFCGHHAEAALDSVLGDGTFLSVLMMMASLTFTQA